ncbi:hypothetical protein A9264_05470 [Vibrio sp. UCD-FRSSP16_10]|uniref:hypothetical protein n=1 Tax=unclassified Vibrio TaxID=2614977 RepID=UPI0007FF390D|nr:MULTISPECIES: hypothetical protein [unclassified Vibrio]OBT07920.1 hypothetical protein A9260_07710 [Vibrio sp. UCD-FRSSP16_30]OBT17095.1 hypothetical protein A9264_05470 [Vibrio sp. UCD-FRSSP16_10]
MDISSSMFLAQGTGFDKQCKVLSPTTQSQQASQAIYCALEIIDAIRCHRSYLYKELTNQQLRLGELSAIKRRIKTLSLELSNHPSLGSSTERRILTLRLQQLVLKKQRSSFTKQLVVHGQVIRLLFFCCDCAMLRMAKGNKLAVSTYIEQWQTLSDVIDALTQYRVSIGFLIQRDGHNPKLLLGRAISLLNKVRRFNQQKITTSHSFNQIIMRLNTTMDAMKVGSYVPGYWLYDETNNLSRELIKLYRQIILQQMNRCTISQDNDIA